ncbi:protein of unknown function (plasmid) [Agrobacterium pusense]|uniref:Uncharacterized protein n=1 Tax=Agrobacterium pusense TaxID=648995 RepID=U4Q559_9HYPH|nr:protein of unknown function [Agrobacterium pusense]
MDWGSAHCFPHADDPKSAGHLMAFVQGGGHIIASIMPFAAGWLRGRSDDLPISGS